MGLQPEGHPEGGQETGGAGGDEDRLEMAHCDHCEKLEEAGRTAVPGGCEIVCKDKRPRDYDLQLEEQIKQARKGRRSRKRA